MGDPRGFMKHGREQAKKRSVEERIGDWREFELPVPQETLMKQGARCMDCGVPFCHHGCPLGNLIPVWNDHVYRGRWKEAIEALHSTNNFPEFTGRVCPAPCETSCVLGINEPAVSIKLIENSIINRAFDEGRVVAEPPTLRTGKRVAVVGSGPAGLAAAHQLNRAGHTVTVFERAERVGGLLTFGIPDFKLEKSVVERRVKLMEQEGIHFRTSAWVGRDVEVEWLRKEFHAVCLAGGSTAARDLPAPGRELAGIHLAMEFLAQQNRRLAGVVIPDEASILATGKRVVVIGGGDTGSDCVGTSIRQGAKSVLQIEILPKPPVERTPEMPWPRWPAILRTSTSQEEGCERDWSVLTKSFEGEHGAVKKILCARAEWKKDRKGRLQPKPIDGTDFEIPADLVLLALGFLGPEKEGMLEQFGVKLDARGNVETDARMMTSVPGVFSAGDMRRGQSLVVWAIDEGRRCAAEMNRYLIGLDAPKAAATPL